MDAVHHHATAEQLATLVHSLRELAATHRRNDLRQRLNAAQEHLNHTEVRVVIVGQFKQGKSALVNALVASPVCPVDDVIATLVPTVIRWGEHTSATLITEFADHEEILHTEVDARNLRHHVTELAGDVGIRGNLRAEVTLPQPLLSSGLVLIDTPGFGRAQVRTSTNLALLPQADIAIMVSDATQELTQPELSFVNNAVSLCPRTICVVSKTDLQYQWREIVQANREHLSAAAIDIEVMETSAVLHDLALREVDQELRQEANVDRLAKHLHDKMRRDVMHTRYSAVAADLVGIGGHLAMSVEAELEALRDPRASSAIALSLSDAEQTVSELARRSARWQQTLSDGAGELVSDIEFDLRDRLREVGREAEQLIDSSDPGSTWDAIGTWLAESVTQAVSDNFVWAHQRSMHLAEVVSQHFTIDERIALPALDIAGTDHVLDSVGGLEVVDPGKLSAGKKLMIGLKGSYGGVLMFGLITTLAGMALVNPISLAAGVIMGGFAYRQDAQQRIDQRRAEAKAAVRKLIDESIFQVSKESRDRMGRIKRTLRDHFIEVAEDLKHTIAETRKAAQQSASLPPTEHEQRVAALTRSLDEVRALIEQASRFVHPEQPSNLALNGTPHE